MEAAEEKQDGISICLWQRWRPCLHCWQLTQRNGLTLTQAPWVMLKVISDTLYENDPDTNQPVFFFNFFVYFLKFAVFLSFNIFVFFFISPFCTESKMYYIPKKWKLKVWSERKSLATNVTKANQWPWYFTQNGFVIVRTWLNLIEPDVFKQWMKLNWGSSLKNLLMPLRFSAPIRLPSVIQCGQSEEGVIKMADLEPWLWPLTGFVLTFPLF